MRQGRWHKSLIFTMRPLISTTKMFTSILWMHSIRYHSLALSIKNTSAFMVEFHKNKILQPTWKLIGLMRCLWKDHSATWCGLTLSLMIVGKRNQVYLLIWILKETVLFSMDRSWQAASWKKISLSTLWEPMKFKSKDLSSTLGPNGRIFQWFIQYFLLPITVEHTEIKEQS